MSYFPMFIDLEGKKIVVVGGGKSALRRVNALLYFGARIAVMAPKICDEIKEIRGIHVKECNFSLEFLDSADIIIAATQRRDINEKIGVYCKEKNINVNVADCPELSSFLMPGVVVRDDLVIGITTGGKSASVSKKIKQMLERMIPMEYGVLTRKMTAYTDLAKMNISDQAKREMALDEIVNQAVNNKCNLDDKKATKILEKYYN